MAAIRRKYCASSGAWRPGTCIACMPEAVVIAFSAGPSTSSATSRCCARDLDHRLAQPGIDQRVEHGGAPAGGRLQCARQLLPRLHPGVAVQLDLGIAELRLGRPRHPCRGVSGRVGDDVDLERVRHGPDSTARHRRGCDIQAPVRDVVVIGGGVVGCAVARRLSQHRRPRDAGRGRARPLRGRLEGQHGHRHQRRRLPSGNARARPGAPIQPGLGGAVRTPGHALPPHRHAGRGADRRRTSATCPSCCATHTSAARPRRS